MPSNNRLKLRQKYNILVHNDVLKSGDFVD